jgi:hypothetical protein
MLGERSIEFISFKYSKADIVNQIEPNINTPNVEDLFLIV